MLSLALCSLWRKPFSHSLIGMYMEGEDVCIFILSKATSGCCWSQKSWPETELKLLFCESRKGSWKVLKKLYVDFICVKEYCNLGHMSVVRNGSLGNYYLRHCKVICKLSSTTPLHMVFNALGKSNQMPSLNQALMTRPVIQHDLLDILIYHFARIFYTLQILQKCTGWYGYILTIAICSEFSGGIHHSKPWWIQAEYSHLQYCICLIHCPKVSRCHSQLRQSQTALTC